MSQATRPCFLEPFGPLGSRCKNCGLIEIDAVWVGLKGSSYAPGCKGYVAPVQLDDNDISLEGPPQPAKAPSKYGNCYDCGIELSPYLDATYERRLQGLCVRCQKSAKTRAPFSFEP